MINLGAIVQATDFDGDTVTGNAAGLVITVDDDTPVINAKTDLIYANSSNPSPGGTGVYSYDIGADERSVYSASSSDFVVTLADGTVGTTDISNISLNWSSETAQNALFNFSFNYGAGSSSGTLLFDKVAGTYTMQLAEPIADVVALSDASAGFTGYLAGTATPDNSGLVQVSVAQLSSDFFVQFTGDAEPGGGAGVNNLQAIKTGEVLDNTLPIALDNQTFTQGTTDLFKQASALVSVSGSAAGVASDIMQSGEVLDFDLFTSNPTGFTNLAPTARASEIFMVFDGLGVTTDMVVILKLVDPDTNVHITKAIVVDAGDIYRLGDIIPGGFPTLDNNDGLIIIQSNDYNFGSENWLIEGGQVLSSTEGVIGANLIDFNRAIGSAGASVDGADDFGAAHNRRR